jgi:hypothetical protein
MAANSGDFPGLSKKLDGLMGELSGENARRRLEVAGKKMEPLVAQAVQNDIGDHSLSGWTHKAPMNITGHSEKAKSTDTGIFIAPGAADTLWHRGLGAMRVLESGRNSYAAGDRRVSGSRVRKKDGQRVAKTRKVKGNVGATKGKGTWADAETLIDAHAARAINDALVQVALEKYF